LARDRIIITPIYQIFIKLLYVNAIAYFFHIWTKSLLWKIYLLGNTIFKGENILYTSMEYNIIGDRDLKEHLQQLIQELNVADKVKLLGWKNQP
jgi:hypothetical protein